MNQRLSKMESKRQKLQNKEIEFDQTQNLKIWIAELEAANLELLNELKNKS